MDPAMETEACDEDVTAYADECGNTGSRLFDRSQPFFWTATALSRQDLDCTAGNVVKRCCEAIGQPN